MIRFPGLNLEFNVNNIAFRIFGIDIYSYAICIAFAIIAAIIVCKIQKEKFRIKFDDVFDCMIFAIIFGIIGARIYYCMFNFEYYFANPIRFFKIRDGGLAIYGGLIAGTIGIIVRCRKLNINYIDLLDYIAPSVSLAQSIGRWGNFFNKEAYGTITNNILRMGIYTEYGYQEVHPTFLYESVATFLIFLCLIFLQKNRKFKGEIIICYLVLYSGVRMLIEEIRMDSLMLGNFRISQILSIAIFVVFSIILAKKYRKSLILNKIEKKSGKKSTKNLI